jgi:hypothetical protein
MCVRCPLALSKRQMSTRPVMPAKPTGAQSALFNGLSSGPDVSGGPDTSVVLGSASRTLCDDAPAAGTANTIARARPEWRSKGPSMDGLVVTYRTPIRAAGGGRRSRSGPLAHL